MMPPIYADTPVSTTVKKLVMFGELIIRLCQHEIENGTWPPSEEVKNQMIEHALEHAILPSN